MGRTGMEHFNDDAREEIKDLPNCDNELTDDDLDDVSGGEEGWVPGTGTGTGTGSGDTSGEGG